MLATIVFIRLMATDKLNHLSKPQLVRHMLEEQPTTCSLKKELVQSNKKICIRERASNKLYGGDNARRLLNLPLNQNIDVRPDTNALFDIFVESTSVNRKILAGTSVLVFTTA